MLREANNYVKIEGILNEVALNYTSYPKNGKTVEAISGVIYVRVEQTINGEEQTLIVPVHMFSNRLKNNGEPNPAYTSIEKVMKEFVSVAASSYEQADRVRINNAKISMNEYPSKTTGNIVSFPRITASFVNKVKKEELKPEATFSIEFMVASAEYETDAEGVETGRYKVVGIVPGYNDSINVIPFFGESEGVISAISTFWGEGDTVAAHGRLNFTTKTETVTTQSGFGDPETRTRTINTSDLIITGGTETPLEGEMAYTAEAIQPALAARKARLEKAKTEAKTKSAPSTTPDSRTGKIDVGF